MDFETLIICKDGSILFVDIAAPPMNLLGAELVGDLVSLIQQAEGDNTTKVLVFKTADPDYFIPHVDVTRISEYRQQAARLTGDASIGPYSISARAILSPSRRSWAAFAPPATSFCWHATCALLRACRRYLPSARSARCQLGSVP